MNRVFEACGPAMKVWKRLVSSGHRSFIAGGAVRDSLLGREVHDLDIVTEARPEEVMALFSWVGPERVGRQFPLVLVRGVEVATLRGETLEEDLLARDLTINAMAWDPEKEELIDPWGGRRDIDSNVLRFTEDGVSRITEDPLRMLRMARFSADLDWPVASESIAAMKAQKEQMEKVAFERIHHEIMKAMAGKRASRFFDVTLESGILSSLFPAMIESVGHDGGHHHDETVWEHMMMAADAISPRFPLLRLAMALHDMAKPGCAQWSEKGLRFIGHEKVGEPMVARDLKHLGFSNRERAYVAKIVRHHMRRIAEETTPKAVRRILRDLAASELPWRDWMRGVIADAKANRKKRGGYSLSEIRQMVRAVYDEIHPLNEGAYTLSHLDVKGDDLMEYLKISRGPEVGRILKALLEKVIEDPSLNRRERLLREAKKM
ncbi:MAG: CCA tRNA nucleotidyltransferase [Desulfobacterales bacterium]|nr:CCA tRNA nucleotidyltransferase [Desulfobacterales bacterium]